MTPNEEDMNQKKLFFTLLLMLSALAYGCGPSSEHGTSMTAADWRKATPAYQNDAGTGTDASCDRPNVVMIGYGEVNGAFSEGDEEDCFDFQYTVGDILEITITSSAGLTLRPLVDANRYSIIVDLLQFQSTNKTFQHVETNYYLKFVQGRDRYDEGDGQRTLSLRISAVGVGTYTLKMSGTPQNDAGTGGDVAEGSQSITLTPGTYTGFLGYYDACDEFFYNPLQFVSGLEVSANPDPGLDVALLWYSSYGTSLGMVSVQRDKSEDRQGKGGAESTWVPVLAYRPSVTVCRGGGTAGGYTLNISAK